MKFKDVPKLVRSQVTNGIRKAFKFSYLHGDCTQDARRERPRFKKDGNLSKVPDVYFECAKCTIEYKQVDTQVDHVDPVIPVGKTLLEMTICEYTHRALYNPVQVLCKVCHKDKTTLENKQRRKLCK